MADHSTEADARIVIDDLLRAAGWDPADKSQVSTSVPVHHHEGAKAGVNKPGGFADYVLRGQNGHPLAIIEAIAGSRRGVYW